VSDGSGAFIKCSAAGRRGEGSKQTSKGVLSRKFKLQQGKSMGVFAVVVTGGGGDGWFMHHFIVA
jgi:hypothetical protein